MPPGAIVAAGLAVGVAGDIIGGNAKQNAAQEQLASAQKAQALAVPTQGELDTLNSQVTNYSAAYTNAQSQLSQLQTQVTQTYGSDILTAGQQLLTQLQGGQSAQTQAAQAQVDKQRQQMQAQLTAQLGPGAMTSSAGIQAMANFNFQANQYLTNVGTQSVNNLVSQIGSLQGSQSSAVNDILNVNKNLTGMLGQIQQTQFNLQQRQVSAQNGVTQYEGADQIGAASLGQGLAQIGTSVASAAAYAGAKGSVTPTDASTTGINSTGTAQTNALNGFNQTLQATGGNINGTSSTMPASLQQMTPTNNSSITTMSLGNGGNGSNDTSQLKMSNVG